MLLPVDEVAGGKDLIPGEITEMQQRSINGFLLLSARQRTSFEYKSHFTLYCPVTLPNEDRILLTLPSSVCRNADGISWP
jgi:hypothetical protein